MKQFIYFFIAVLSVFLAIFSLTNMPLAFIRDDADNQPPFYTFIGLYLIGEFLFIFLLAKYKEHKSRIKLVLISKISLIILIILHSITENFCDTDYRLLSHWIPSYYFIPNPEVYFERYDERKFYMSGYFYYYYPMLFIIYYCYRLLKISLNIQFKNKKLYNLRGILLVVILELALLYITFFSICIDTNRERLEIYSPILTLFTYALVFFIIYVLKKKSILELKGIAWICHFINFNFAMASLVFWRGYILNYSKFNFLGYNLSPFFNNAITTNPIYLYSLLNYVFVMMFMCYSLYHLLLELEIIEVKPNIGK